MNIHPIGSAVVIGDVSNGACFAWRPGDQTYVGIKLTNGKSVAVLWPHHPNDDLALVCSLFPVSDLERHPIWLLPEAIIKPNATVARMHSSSNEVRLGWLAGTLWC
jgi:hypothetical protein